MPYLVRAFPILPNKVTQLRLLATETSGARREIASRFYRALGITHESWHFQGTAGGDHLIVVTQVDNVQRRGEQYAAMQDEYAEWFKSRVRALSGIDPDVSPLGPATEQLFEWNSPVSPKS